MFKYSLFWNTIVFLHIFLTNAHIRPAVPPLRTLSTLYLSLKKIFYLVIRWFFPICPSVSSPSKMLNTLICLYWLSSSLSVFVLYTCKAVFIQFIMSLKLLIKYVCVSVSSLRRNLCHLIIRPFSFSTYVYTLPYLPLYSSISVSYSLFLRQFALKPFLFVLSCFLLYTFRHSFSMLTFSLFSAKRFYTSVTYFFLI